MQLPSLKKRLSESNYKLSNQEILNILRDLELALDEVNSQIIKDRIIPFLDSKNSSLVPQAQAALEMLTDSYPEFLETIEVKSLEVSFINEVNSIAVTESRSFILAQKLYGYIQDLAKQQKLDQNRDMLAQMLSSDQIKNAINEGYDQAEQQTVNDLMEVKEVITGVFQEADKSQRSAMQSGINSWISTL